MQHNDIFARAAARILIRYLVGPFLLAAFMGASVAAEILVDPEFEVLVEMGIAALASAFSAWLVARTEKARLAAKKEGGDL